MTKQTLFVALLLLCNAVAAQNDPDLLGRVDGAPILWGDFLRYESTIYPNTENNRYHIRTQVWDYFVENALVRREAARIGLGVSEEEMEALQFGDLYGGEISPIIRQRFSDEYGQVDWQQLQAIRYAIARGDLPPHVQSYWKIQEAEIEKERLQSKLTALLAQSCYTPKWQAEMAFRELNEEIEIQYVRIPYDNISNGDTAPSDDDLNAFADQFPRLYYQDEERRVLDYWLFPVAPSAADSAAVRAELEALRPAFQKAGNDSLFNAAHQVFLTHAFYRRDDLLEEPAMTAEVVDQLFKARPGTVTGPFWAYRGWVLVKVLEHRVLPDSVRARHILLRTDEEDPEAERRIDDMLARLRAGTANFVELAEAYSEDISTRERGGDIGWVYQGQTVPEFDTLCFIHGEPGRFYKIKTQFGWHLVEITGQSFLTKEKRVRLAIIYRDVVASPETERKARASAESIFAAAPDLATLQALAEREGLALTRSRPLKINDFWLQDLTDQEQTRQVVRAAFAPDAASGRVLSEVFSFAHPESPAASHFAIFGVRQIIPRGPASAATLRILPGVAQQVAHRKKAAAIAAQTRPAERLDQIAAQWGVPVEPAKSRFGWPALVLPPARPETPDVTAAPSPNITTYTWSTSELPVSMPDVTVSTPVSFTTPDALQSSERDWRRRDANRVIGRAFGAEENVLTGPVAGEEGVYYFVKIAQSSADLPSDLRLLQWHTSFTAKAIVRLNWLRDMRSRANIEDFRSRFY